ncbi:unnamed protein product [Amoebophrya sp. A25]|nr:unnamed protein product [Amoebophrya sp. A25]|eukprot:GSA25T00000469001.1
MLIIVLYCYRLRVLRLRREAEEAERQRLEEERLRRMASMLETTESSVDTFIAVIEQERKEAADDGRIPPPSLPYKFKMAKIRGDWAAVGFPKFSDPKSVYYNRIHTRDTLRRETEKRYGFALTTNMLKVDDLPKELFEIAPTKEERKDPHIWDLPEWAKRAGPVMGEFWNWRRSYARHVTPDDWSISWSESVLTTSERAKRRSSSLPPTLLTHEGFDFDFGEGHSQGSSSSAGFKDGEGKTVITSNRPGAVRKAWSPRKMNLEQEGGTPAKLSPAEQARKASESLRRRDQYSTVDSPIRSSDQELILETVGGKAVADDAVTPKRLRKKHSKIVEY